MALLNLGQFYFSTNPLYKYIRNIATQILQYKIFNLKVSKYLIIINLVFSFFNCFAWQDTSLIHKNLAVNNSASAIDSSKQRDVIDIILKILNKNTPANKRKISAKLNFAAVPAAGYSLSTGYGAAVIGNVAFFTSTDHKENLSAISLEAFLDTRAQKVLISRGQVWADKNRYKLVTDLRVEKFPDDTYGLGTFTTNADDVPIVYYYLRTYLTLFRTITPDFYAGIGYSLDYHYNISETGGAPDVISDFRKYGELNASSSSGINYSLLYDSRRNPINPLNGAYASIIYRDNYRFLGSDDNWRELEIDLRKYFRVSPNSNNILAVWALAAFTNGHVPYLDLPATGYDMYDNSGRGYKINRFRGRNMLYAEAEYRFGITSNGLLGAVVFANAESFSEFRSNRFEKIAPAAGPGIRIKMNKHSNTNVSIDYAIGTGGSHGIFATIGEVF